MVSIDTSAPSESCRPSIHSIACRSLHVPPGELPHRTHTIYTPTNTPPRGRWRPLSSRACSIGPMGGTSPRNTPHHALLAAYRLDLRSPDFSLMWPHAKGGGAKMGLWGRALRSPAARARESMATQHNSAPHHAPQTKPSGYRRRSRAKLDRTSIPPLGACSRAVVPRDIRPRLRPCFLLAAKQLQFR